MNNNRHLLNSVTYVKQDGLDVRIAYNAVVDMTALHAMARKAYKSKGKTARTGPLTVRVSVVEATLP